MNKKDLNDLFNTGIAGGALLFLYCFAACVFRGCALREIPKYALKERPRPVSYVDYAHNKVMKTLGPDWEKHTIKDLRIKGRAKKLNGPYKEYWDNGQLRVECNFKNGEYDGLFKSYHEYTGELYEQFTFKEGKYDGPYEYYHDNGQLLEKGTIKDGTHDGPVELYYDNSQLWEKCAYKDGKLDGPYERYDDNGQLKKKGVYRMGERLYGKEAEEYLKEWNEKHNSKEARKGLNARLAQMDKQMAPTQLRQSIKRAEVAKFRAKFPNKKDGR